MTRVLGIDPSLTGTGLALINTDDRLVAETWTIVTKGHHSDTLLQRLDRLDTIVDFVAAVDADLAVIEQSAYSRTAGHQHDRSGLWWLIIARLQPRIPVVEVPPTTRARYATGKGNASKDTVLLEVARRYPHARPANNNEADALVLAAMGARHLGHPIDDLPKTHLAAMDAVHWPSTKAATR